MENSEKTLIIGQAPSRETVGRRAFSGRSGPKFAELLGVRHSDLWEIFDVVNLIDYFPGPSDKRGDSFPAIEARLRAITLRSAMAGRRVVMVGKNVSKAFGIDEDFFAWHFDKAGSFDYCIVPHPSGVSHFWNDQENVSRAKMFMGQIPR